MPNKENLETVLKVLKSRGKIWNYTEVCSKLGITDDYLRMVRKGQKPFTEKLAKSILTMFPDVNYCYLMDGEGEVLLSKEHSSSPVNVDNGSIYVQAGRDAQVNPEHQTELKLVEASKQIESLEKSVREKDEIISLLSEHLRKSDKLNEWLQQQLDKRQ